MYDIGSLKHGDVSSVFARSIVVIACSDNWRLSSSTLRFTGCVLLHNKTYYTETKRLLQAFLVNLVPLDGIEPTIDAYKATVIPFN